MNYVIYSTNADWISNILNLKLTANTKVAFWRTGPAKNFSKDIHKGDIFLMSVKKDGKREVQGIATFEGFYNNIQVVDLWNRYGKNTGATSLSDLIDQLENSGKKEQYSATTLISYIEISNFKCDFCLGSSPWRLL